MRIYHEAYELGDCDNSFPVRRMGALGDDLGFRLHCRGHDPEPYFQTEREWALENAEQEPTVRGAR